ncbi:hypothetical protein PMAYCL1PPCAC_14034, partial [Pristionchus mayeri]
ECPTTQIVSFATARAARGGQGGHHEDYCLLHFHRRRLLSAGREEMTNNELFWHGYLLSAPSGHIARGTPGIIPTQRRRSQHSATV